MSKKRRRRKKGKKTYRRWLLDSLDRIGNNLSAIAHTLEDMNPYEYDEEEWDDDNDDDKPITRKKRGVPLSGGSTAEAPTCHDEPVEHPSLVEDEAGLTNHERVVAEEAAEADNTDAHGTLEG